MPPDLSQVGQGGCSRLKAAWSQFSRLFKEETGQSSAKAIERLRMESARLMMEAGGFSAEEIVGQNGFGNRERMRRAFVRALGQSPQTIQRTVSA